MIQVSAGDFRQGGAWQGQGNASSLVPEDAEAITQVDGVRCGSRFEHARSDRGRQPELERADPAHDVDLPLIRSWQTSVGASSRRRMSPPPLKWLCSAAPFAISCLVSATTRSARLFACHRRFRWQRPEPALHRRRRDGHQRPCRHGSGSRRRHLRAVYHHEEKLGTTFLSRSMSGDISGRDNSGRRRHCGTAACAQQSSLTTRTTSWFARWTKSPASDGKRRRP